MTDAIVAAYRMGHGLLHRMTDDLPPEGFRHQPVSGANSAGWVVGHLAVVLHRTADRLGANPPPLPDGFAEQFAVTKQPAGEQPDYGEPAELVRLFDLYLKVVAEAVGRVPAETLAGPTKTAFSSNFGEGLLFGAMHIAMHSGQLSLVRRGLGMPPLV